MPSPVVCKFARACRSAHGTECHGDRAPKRSMWGQRLSGEISLQLVRQPTTGLECHTSKTGIGPSVHPRHSRRRLALHIAHGFVVARWKTWEG